MACGVALIAAAAVFYRLGEHSVYWWDEARVALNSLEMLRHPDLIVRYRGAPELWNTKPPLAIWLNALSMRVFGINEWALRLPAALAAVGTVLAVYDFTKRVSDRVTGLLAALILLGTGGFVEVHVARSADYDSLLVLFSTLATFSLFFAFETKRFWPVAGFGVAAVLVKGIAGAIMVPGYLLYALLTRKDIRPAIVPATVAFVVVAAFYAARELASPGYLAAMWQWDVARFGEHQQDYIRSTYLMSLFWPWPVVLFEDWTQPMYTASAFPWSTVALASLIRPSRAATYLWCCLGTFLVLVSLAATRHGWYIAPVHPLIAVLCALGVRQSAIGRRLAFAAAILFIGLNLWKIDKATDTPPQHFVFRTPDGKIYRGPDEFYELSRCDPNC
jgi:4-amino-4-deoxy-L-arabinose transferase-like glycosyltransferase